jgi:hypothetical protein
MLLLTVGYRSFVELAEDDEINKIVEVNCLVKKYVERSSQYSGSRKKATS